MQFFLYEILARIVAAYLVFDCYRRLSRSLAERKTTYWNSDWVTWILDSSNYVANRDTTPVQYWMQIGFQVIALIACIAVAIFGWFPSNS